MLRFKPPAGKDPNQSATDIKAGLSSQFPGIKFTQVEVVGPKVSGELFRSGFLMQAAAANHDFITPPVVSAAEADYERNLANTIDLAYLLVHDEKFGAANAKLFQSWAKKHAALADKAALGLQPIWSMPHSKPVAFADVRAQSEERVGKILGELGLKR